ncbi:hypothetical protein Droror1_Dr00027344 [Drosera rotundifolia]
MPHTTHHRTSSPPHSPRSVLRHPSIPAATPSFTIFKLLLTPSASPSSLNPLHITASYRHYEPRLCPSPSHSRCWRWMGDGESSDGAVNRSSRGAGFGEGKLRD